jgi:hypothetical protein
VRELSVCGNGVAEVPAAAAARLTALETLHVGDNLVSSWAALAPLERLPALARLHLNGNPIEGACPSACPSSPTGKGVCGEGSAAAYAALQSLNLSGTRLAAWAEVDALAQLAALRDLRIQVGAFSAAPTARSDPPARRQTVRGRAARCWI